MGKTAASPLARGLAAALSVAVGGCSSHRSSIAGGTGVHGEPGAPTPSSSVAARASPDVHGGRLERTPLGDARDVALPFSLQSISGGRSLLFVSQLAGERAAWVRRLDGATGSRGPVLALLDEHVVGAFEGSEGRTTLVTSDGTQLCIASYRADASHPEARGCAKVSPSILAAVGDKLALIEVGAPPSLTPRTPAPKLATAPSRPPATTKTKKPASKGSVKGAGRNVKKKPARKVFSAPWRPPQPRTVEVRIRWASPAGDIDSEAKTTGLSFAEPLAGMGLVDARARGERLDLLWLEAAPKRRSRTPFGSARLMAASIASVGQLDRASRVPVLDGDLDYGALHDHKGLRLTGDATASVVVGLDAKGHCEATRVLPQLARLAPTGAACAIDPDRLAASPPASAGELAAFERIVAEAPRRTFGQPRGDLGLVAWAGDRAYFLARSKLLSSSRDDGAARDEPDPFPARRAPIAWGAVAHDGEGIAVTGDDVVHIDARGAISRIRAAVERSSPMLSEALHARELPVDRRRAARIGTTWWLARGDVVRVWPELASPAALRGAAPADTSSLVGGASHGILIDLAGEALRVVAVDSSGGVARLAATPAQAPRSPVRAGFDACERAQGGALVAGVSAEDSRRVVTFAVDTDGRVGRATAAPLPVHAGELAVRLIALPGGGAVLTDRDRRYAVWLDDDARPIANAPWPPDASTAVCVDGRPVRTLVPAPAPGTFTRIDDAAAKGACIVGDATWMGDGRLAWLGSATSGLDAIAELVVTRDAPGTVAAARPASRPIVADVAAVVAKRPVCPSDMVSIADRHCIDRFEATIVDAKTREPLSADFPTTPNLLDVALSEWATGRERVGNVHARAFPLPWIAPERLGRKIDPLAVARLGVRPNGYVTGLVAETACTAAGKRLCTLEEFVTACRGEDDTQFPYGDTYEDGLCNVYREDHPAALLHDNASMGHLDPRLNRVTSKGRPLHQLTGESRACRSRWGNDAAYDLVGNLDEWVDEGAGAFAGGFYARSTRSGCDALVASHPRAYLDYSTGVRCCKDAAASR